MQVTGNFKQQSFNNMKAKILNYFIILGLFLNSCGQISHAKFDSDKWKNSNLNLEENWSLRWEMMNDLRKNYDLIGMTKSDIENLLGNNGDDTSKEFYYYLGMTGTGINTGRLIIIFDENDIVKDFKVFQG